HEFRSFRIVGKGRQDLVLVVRRRTGIPDVRVNPFAVACPSHVPRDRRGVRIHHVIHVREISTPQVVGTRESLDQPPTVVRSGCGNPLQGATSGEGPTPGKDFPEVLPRVPHSQVNGSGVVCRRHAAQGTALTYTAIRPRVPHDPEWTGTRCVARYHDVLWHVQSSECGGETG